MGFFIMPWKLAIPCILAVVVIAVIHWVRFKISGEDQEALKRRLDKLIRIVQMYLVITVALGNFGLARGVLGLVGTNVVLFCLYIMIVPLLMLKGRRLGLWGVIGVILMLRFSVLSYMSMEPSSIMIMVLAFVVMMLVQQIVQQQSQRKYQVIIISSMVIAFLVTGVIPSIINRDETPEITSQVTPHPTPSITYECNHNPHVSMEKLLLCLEENQLILPSQDHIEKTENKVEISRGGSTIKLIEFTSSKEAEAYCEANDLEHRRFFTGNYAWIEVENEEKDFDFDRMNQVYMEAYK